MPKRNEEYKRIKEDPGFIRSEVGALALYVSIVAEKNVSQSFYSLGFHKQVKSSLRHYKGKYTEETILDAIDMREKGYKWKDIGEKIKVNSDVIRTCVSRYLRTHDKR